MSDRHWKKQSFKEWTFQANFRSSTQSKIPSLIREGKKIAKPITHCQKFGQKQANL